MTVKISEKFGGFGAFDFMFKIHQKLAKNDCVYGGRK